MGSNEGQRDTWRQDSILEIWSRSLSKWFAAQVLNVQLGVGYGEGPPDMLTMQYWYPDDAQQPRRKSLYRNDCQLQPLGTNLPEELPPGFGVKSVTGQSGAFIFTGWQSRPDDVYFFDAHTRKQYQTAEQAWQVHFQRLSEPPAAPGMETAGLVTQQQQYQAPHHHRSRNTEPEKTNFLRLTGLEIGTTKSAVVNFLGEFGIRGEHVAMGPQQGTPNGEAFLAFTSADLAESALLYTDHLCRSSEQEWIAAAKPGKLGSLSPIAEADEDDLSAFAAPPEERAQMQEAQNAALLKRAFAIISQEDALADLKTAEEGQADVVEKAVMVQQSLKKARTHAEQGLALQRAGMALSGQGDAAHMLTWSGAP